MSACLLCKRKDAFFMRPYSGQKLCESCFSRSIEDKVRATISKYDMLKPDDDVMVALSGGKDSASLLHVLYKMERNFPKASLSAVTVDEGIKGYRDEALKFAKKSCEKFSVEHVVTSFKEMYGYTLDEIVSLTRNKREKGLTPCSYCGVMRRQALNTAAREALVNKLATAHTLDDEIQTMILNLFHGDAARIARIKPVVTAVHPKLVQRIKPACGVPGRELVLYAHLKKIEFQTRPCPYAGTALRNDIRNMLNRMERKHAGIKFTIFKTMKTVRGALETEVEEVNIRECKICGEPTVRKICKVCEMLQELSIL